jgi:hypothetical protein
MFLIFDKLAFGINSAFAGNKSNSTLITICSYSQKRGKSNSVFPGLPIRLSVRFEVVKIILTIKLLYEK